MARKVGKHNYPYDKIKGALPCFIPFYRHNNKVNKGTLKKSTNYIYIDIDEDVSFDPSQHDFVVACWKSLSGNGKGVLISVDNMVPRKKVTTEILKKIGFEVSNSMDINPDLGAVSLDRVNVIGYDEDVYYNPQHSSYALSNNYKEESVKKNTKKLSSINKTPSFNRLRLDDTFSNDGIRTSNLDDKIKDIVFGDNELVRDLGDDKIPYAHVFIPSKIDTG